MNKRQLLRFFAVLWSILCLSGMSLTAYAENTGDRTKTVKVAYLLSPSFQEGGEGEYKTGHGYEYLQKIASYTGWTYEYVYGGFGELLQKLMDGEIDLMGDLSYTDEWAQLISYGSYEQGRESFYVYINGDGSGIRANDNSSFNGKKIGASAGSFQKTLWKEWCEKQNIDCEIVEFHSLQERQDALNNGDIDAALDSMIPNQNEATKNWRSVCSFGDAPFYFGVNKRKPELLQELNKAQGRILNDDPSYNEELIARYVPNGVLSRSQLDEDEMEWLNLHKEPFKIGCLDGYLPISDRNENGEMQGVLPDILKAIREKYLEYDLSYEMVVYNDYEQMIKDLKDGSIDIAAPVYGDYWNADQEGISLTKPFMSTTMLLLQKGRYSADNIKRLGIDKRSPIQTVYAKIYYPNSECILYSSMKEVTDALKKEEIDAALSTACSYHIDAILIGELGELSRSTLPAGVPMSMAVSRGNAELMSIINRGLSSIGDTVIYNSLALNSNVEKKVTLADFVSENPIMTIIISGVIIAILLLIILQLKKANVRARTDAMTGLLNKVSMREQAKDEIKHGGTFFMIDIDNFKAVNDVLGHEAGDKVINCLAEALQDIFRSGDLLSRFGGDEFLVFLPGSMMDENMVQSKVVQMQNALASCEVFNESKEIAACTVSVGVLILEADNKLTYADAFRKVDAALYEAKNKGKKTFVITK